MPGATRASVVERPVTVDANEAVASVAYRSSDTVIIYPITPASPMGEHADAWAAAGRPNRWGTVPRVVEMQSEGGAAGALHGALATGALATSFTASQGLLLMLPNLYKIAGELTPFCLHVAARSVATHALSIFGDHSDVMAVRQTGMAMLASGSPQEAQDLAAVAHAATLEARVPFLHFFDGFRTSHEIQKLLPVGDDVLAALGDDALVEAHRRRRLTPEHPTIRGTAQNPDVFFQAREAANPFHDACPNVVEATMDRFAELTGRRYRPFDYVGHPEAERVVVLMGSAAECAHETVEHLVGLGERVGVVKVRLYRPFSVERLLDALPATATSVAVLDRTKEPGSVGEPLLLDVTAALVEGEASGRLAKLPHIVGGRYGLSSKEFTPAMTKAVFDELASADPRRRFTVGITDDVTGSSLVVDETFDLEAPDVTRAVFYGLGADGTVSSNKAAIRIIGDATDQWCQGHFVYDSKKSGSTTVSHLRFGPRPIRSTYLIRSASFVAVHDPGILGRRPVLDVAAPGATVLINSPHPPEEVWGHLPAVAQEVLASRGCHLYVVDAARLAAEHGLGRRINTIMSTCFFALSGVLPRDEAIERVKASVRETWGRRGPEVVQRNEAAIDATLAELREVPLGEARDGPPLIAAVPADAPPFVAEVTRLMLEGRGDALPVSAFPPDGTWPTGTSRFEKRAIATEIPLWDLDLCIQCNRCSVICPHSAIRTVSFDPAVGAADAVRSAPIVHEPGLEGWRYVVGIAPDDCTGCRLCVEVCPAKDRSNPRHKALDLVDAATHRDAERARWEAVAQLPEPDPTRIGDHTRSVGLLPPRFEFSGACAGCGETPYLRLLSSLFGDRLVVANATGCSSIFGGNLPTTPWTVGDDGRGPAWANSLFEDDGEFGLGMRLGIDALAERARLLLRRLAGLLPVDLVADLTLPGETDAAALAARRARVGDLRIHLAELPRHTAPDLVAAAAELTELADELVPRTVWIVGGDGWAYDIGFGGLDHVLASNLDLNVLVLDTEVYSNTGGQASKATPMGAAAKFATAGKETAKKDLGLLAMSYGHAYVASIGLQANPHQATRALQEAEAHPGPSLVIAHCPCIAHGYDLAQSPVQQRRAIDAGAWPLYRWDPRRVADGEPPLHIDADPLRLPMRDYLRHEARFRMVELRDPDRFDRLASAAEDHARDRHAVYEQLAQIRLPRHDGGPGPSSGGDDRG